MPTRLYSLIVGFLLVLAQPPVLAADPAAEAAGTAPGEAAAVSTEDLRAALWAHAGEGRQTPWPERYMTRIAGRYAGTYLCSATGLHGLTLDLTQVGEPDDEGVRSLSGTLHFYATLANPAAPRGSFQVTGLMAPQGHLVLRPSAWIQRPDNYQWAGIDGRFSPPLLGISGKPTGVAAENSGCTLLMVYRLPGD